MTKVRDSPVAWHIMGCMATWQENRWDWSYAETTTLMAQLCAWVLAGLHDTKAALVATHCQMSWIVWMAQPADTVQPVAYQRSAVAMHLCTMPTTVTC